MLDLILKWTLIALIALAIFSAGIVLWALFQLNMGSCRDGCDGAQTLTAYLYVGLIGIAGFGVSAGAAYLIRRNLS